MAQSFKSNVNGVYSCKYHVVFCPKYRRKVLTGEIAEHTLVIPVAVDPAVVDPPAAAVPEALPATLPAPAFVAAAGVTQE